MTIASSLDNQIINKILSETIDEAVRKHEESLMKEHFYHVYKDISHEDNFGDKPIERVSTYLYSFFSEKYLTPLEAIKYAETRENWECFSFGEAFVGEGKSYVTYTPPKNNPLAKSWKSLEPISI